MKKVVLVVPSLGTGGGEKLVFDLAIQLDKSRFEVYVISLFPRMNNYREAQLECSNVHLIFLDKKPGLDLLTIFRMKKQLKQIAPDIIHSHLDVSLYLFTSYMKKQVKIHTVHSMAQFEAVKLHKLIRKIAFKYYGVTPVAIGPTVKKSIASYYGIMEEKIPIVCNGVVLKRICDAPPKEQSVFQLVSVGTLYYVKNQIMQLTAMKELKEKHGIPVKLTIIGDGNMREELLAKTKEYGLEDLVTFTGWKDDVTPYLAQSDAYLCTSIMEGISLAIIEAMAQGLPVIATDVGGNRDLVVPGRTGYLIPTNDVEALVTAVLDLYHNVECQKEMSENALVASKNYDIVVCTSAYERIYENSDKKE